MYQTHHTPKSHRSQGNECGTALGVIQQICKCPFHWAGSPQWFRSTMVFAGLSSPTNSDDWAANLQTHRHSPPRNVPWAWAPSLRSQKAPCSSKAIRCQHWVYLISIHKSKAWGVTYSSSAKLPLWKQRDTSIPWRCLTLTGSEGCITSRQPQLSETNPTLQTEWQADVP